MDDHRFDLVARHIAQATTRRRLGGLVLALATTANLLPTSSLAKHKKHKKKKKKPPIATCPPACSAASCGGDDGCGGRCQTGSCPGGTSCVRGSCVSGCTPESTAQTCGAHGCGPKTNNCGQTVACGGCGTGETCVSGSCIADNPCGGACQGDKICVGNRCQCPTDRPHACPNSHYLNVCSADLSSESRCCFANGIDGNNSPCPVGQSCCQGVCNGGCASGNGGCLGLCPGNNCEVCPQSAPLCCNAGPPTYGTSCVAAQVCP